MEADAPRGTVGAGDEGPMDRRAARTSRRSPTSASTCSSSAAGSSARGAARRDEPGAAGGARRAARHRVGDVGRSSRLIHGGLRYLEQLHFGLVYEALAERARLLRLAPHLVRLEPFLFPIYGIPLVHQGFYGSGIFLYDLLGARRDGGFAKHLRPSSAIEYAPEPPPQGPAGGIIYHDGVEDDARLGPRGPADGARRRRGGGDAGPGTRAAARRGAGDRGPVAIS